MCCTWPQAGAVALEAGTAAACSAAAGPRRRWPLREGVWRVDTMYIELKSTNIKTCTHSKLGSGDLATLGESSAQRGAGASAGSRRSDDAPRQLKVTEEEGAGSKACI